MLRLYHQLFLRTASPQLLCYPVNASLNALQQCPISHVNAFGGEYPMNTELVGM